MVGMTLASRRISCLFILLWGLTSVTAKTCSVNADCNGRSICSNSTNSCFTPSLLEGGDYRDALGATACFLGASLASGAGLGGGGMFVPLLLIVGGFSTTEAVPLSQSLMFGAGLMNLYIYSQQKHPLDDKRSIIDLVTILMFEPALLAGVVVGVILNAMSPTWLVVAFLVSCCFRPAVFYDPHAHRLLPLGWVSKKLERME